MIIHSCRLKNFCQHRDLQVTLSSGLNMIIGPNGSGKTNFLRGLQLGLTGDAGGDRLKANDIRQGITNDEESFVELQVTHAGADMVILRGLRPSTNLLAIGDQTWRTVGEINRELWQRLGVTKKRLDDYVFVKQRLIDAMFDKSPAERAAMQASLYSIDKAERIWTAIGEATREITVPVTTLDTSAMAAALDTARQQVARLSAKYDSLQRQAAKLDETNTQLLQLENCARQHASLEQKLRTLSDRLVAAMQHGESLAAKNAPLRADLDSVNAALVEIRMAANDAEQALEKWRILDVTEATRKRIEASKQQLAALPPLIAPTPVNALSSHELDLLLNARDAAKTLRITIRQMENSPTQCPTCGQAMPDAEQNAKLLATKRAQLQEIETNKQPYEEASLLYDNFQKQLAAYTDEANRRAELERSIQEQESDLPKVDAPAMPKEAAFGIISERDGYVAALRHTNECIDKNEALIDLAHDRITDINNEMAEVRRERSHLPLTCDAVLHELRRSVGAMKKSRDEAIEIRIKLAEVQARVTALEMQLADTLRVEEQGRHVRSVLDHVEELRRIFHRDEAPRMVDYTLTEKLLDEINETLEEFQSPFKVEMSESRGFTAKFDDGRVIADRFLSVGERIVLALAYRVIINATFAREMGMLVMDEPTAGLDEGNLGCLPAAIQQLKRLSEQRGLQVLFVTHEPRIANLFDNTIAIST